MKPNPILNQIRQAAKKDHFVKFSYTKENETVPTERIVRFGGNIAKRMEKQGTPINGRGNWTTGAEKSGKNSMIVRKNGKIYVRGTEVKGAESKHKIFILSGIALK